MDCKEALSTLCKALCAQHSELLKCLHITTQLTSFSTGLKEVHKSVPELRTKLFSLQTASLPLLNYSPQNILSKLLVYSEDTLQNTFANSDPNLFPLN